MSVSKISYGPRGGIEIDHGDADLSGALEGHEITLAIGEDFTGRARPDKAQGYARYLEFRMQVSEARALRDWLNDMIERCP